MLSVISVWVELAECVLRIEPGSSRYEVRVLNHNIQCIVLYCYWVVVRHNLFDLYKTNICSSTKLKQYIFCSVFWYGNIITSCNRNEVGLSCQAFSVLSAVSWLHNFEDSDIFYWQFSIYSIICSEILALHVNTAAMNFCVSGI